MRGTWSRLKQESIYNLGNTSPFTLTVKIFVDCFARVPPLSFSSVFQVIFSNSYQVFFTPVIVFQPKLPSLYCKLLEIYSILILRIFSFGSATHHPLQTTFLLLPPLISTLFAPRKLFSGSKRNAFEYVLCAFWGKQKNPFFQFDFRSERHRFRFPLSDSSNARRLIASQ